ncbi:MAG: 2-oxoacid:acceptor oxidoreductase family protein [Oscillospiraceae bacterium]|nr:2-oxoacid:acceptor oxidoreductase family protein [Oscillospiraceae bacterium]
MTKSILIAGTGGQGIQFAGKQLAGTGLAFDKYVSYIPSYGPEARGGTSNCRVIISDEEIGSPVFNKPDILMVFNLESFEKYEPMLRAGGILFSDSSLVNKISWRDDLNGTYYIPASGLASDNGLTGMANVIMLAKMLAVTKIFGRDEFLDHMLESIPKSRAAMIDLNRRAFNIGYSYK